jgi:hypothetical protein
MDSGCQNALYFLNNVFSWIIWMLHLIWDLYNLSLKWFVDQPQLWFTTTMIRNQWSEYTSFFQDFLWFFVVPDSSFLPNKYPPTCNSSYSLVMPLQLSNSVLCNKVSSCLKLLCSFVLESGVQSVTSIFLLYPMDSPLESVSVSPHWLVLMYIYLHHKNLTAESTMLPHCKFVPSGARDQIFVFCLTIAGFLIQKCPYIIWAYIKVKYVFLRNPFNLPTVAHIEIMYIIIISQKNIDYIFISCIPVIFVP